MRFSRRCLSQRVEICLHRKPCTLLATWWQKSSAVRGASRAAFLWIDWNRPNTRVWHCLCRAWHPHSAVVMMSNQLIEKSRCSHWSLGTLRRLPQCRHLVCHMCCSTAGTCSGVTSIAIFELVFETNLIYPSSVLWDFPTNRCHPVPAETAALAWVNSSEKFQTRDLIIEEQPFRHGKQAAGELLLS